MNAATVTIGSRSFICEVAATVSEIAAGLSGRASLAVGHGMLFDLGSTYSNIVINMDDMLFPLDIVFIDATLKVISTKIGAVPGETGVQEDNVRYFMEVNAGEADMFFSAGEAVEIVIAVSGINISEIISLMVSMMIVVMMMKIMMGTMQNV